MKNVIVANFKMVFVFDVIVGGNMRMKKRWSKYEQGMYVMLIINIVGQVKALGGSTSLSDHWFGYEPIPEIWRYFETQNHEEHGCGF